LRCLARVFGLAALLSTLLMTGFEAVLPSGQVTMISVRLKAGFGKQAFGIAILDTDLRSFDARRGLCWNLGRISSKGVRDGKPDLLADVHCRLRVWILCA
jgi:hypothetical protein